MRLPRFRLTPRAANVLIVVGLLSLFGVVSLTAPRWARFLRQPLASLEEEPPSAVAARPGKTPEAEAESRISVKLFFETADRAGLLSEERSVPFSNDLSQQVRVVVEELIRGSRTGLVSPFTPQGRVLEVFVSAGGVAYLDLSKEVTGAIPGGSKAELLAVYSLVNSVAINFPSVKRVQILLDDHPVGTFAGHVDVSRPLPADLTFLAPAPMASVPPSPGP